MYYVIRDISREKKKNARLGLGHSTRTTKSNNLEGHYYSEGMYFSCENIVKKNRPICANGPFRRMHFYIFLEVSFFHLLEYSMSTG